jgi:hypothetical protein
MSNAHVQRNQTLLLRPTNEVFSSSPDISVLFLCVSIYYSKQILLRKGNVRRFLSIAQPPKDTPKRHLFEIMIRVGHPKYFFGLFSFFWN